jgi:hypothetical protein
MFGHEKVDFEMMIKESFFKSQVKLGDVSSSTETDE